MISSLMKKRKIPEFSMNSKHLRFHFKVATILVGIALFFFTVALSIDLIVRIFYYSLCSLTLLHRFCILKQVDLFSTYVIVLTSHPSAFNCRIIFRPMFVNYLFQLQHLIKILLPHLIVIIFIIVIKSNLLLGEHDCIY